MFLLSFVKGSKSAEGGPNPLADMDRGSPNPLGHRHRRGQGPVSRKSRELSGPEKPFVKLRPAYSVKLIFSHVVKVIKNKNNGKVSCLETPSLRRYKENYLTRNTPEKFRDFRETDPRVRVPFGPQFFLPLFRYCLSSIAKLRRSLTSKSCLFVCFCLGVAVEQWKSQVSTWRVKSSDNCQVDYLHCQNKRFNCFHFVFSVQDVVNNWWSYNLPLHVRCQR